MKILVANLGSTSFKYRLFDMANSEKLLARGGVERIGSSQSRSFVKSEMCVREVTASVPDHAAAVSACLRLLVDKEIGVLSSVKELAGIGFKAVHPGTLDPDGPVIVTEEVICAMSAFNDVAPAHNPIYVNAMRLISAQHPEIPQVAAFETVFHRGISESRRAYAIPASWRCDLGIKRYGFHGASHRYICERSAEVLKKPAAKIVSCHLGGSSSLCAIDQGQSIATTMGLSPQSGLPQNNRVGDLDVFALPVLEHRTGKSFDQILADLGSQGGLFGLSNGFSNDLEALGKAASEGNKDAQFAIEVYVDSIRHYLGAFLLHLNGADAIIFTGGIGENSAMIRSAVCNQLGWFGIYLDAARNSSAQGEMQIHAEGSRAEIWIMPTNEEIVVARQTRDCLMTQGRHHVSG